MKIKELNPKQNDYLIKHKLVSKFKKAKELFENNPHHPSLKLEILEPKNLKIYSFRIDIKYRVVFVIINNEAEVIAITNHYK